MTLYTLCGLPGSGKTTLSEQLSAQHNAALYHYDEFKKGRRAQESRKTHQDMFALIAADLLADHNVVVDDLHLRKEWRIDLLNSVRGIPCTKILIVLTTPLEECVRRNNGRPNRLPKDVIYHLSQRYEPPTLDEGWDEILYL